MNPEPDYTVYESNYICTDRLQQYEDASPQKEW